MNLFQRTTRRSMVMIAVVTVIVLAVSAAALRGRQTAADAAASVRTERPVAEFLQADLYIVEPRNLNRVFPLTGSLMPLTEATVKAKVAGELVAVTAREGESVKQGQVLARIDLTEVQARVAAREAEVAATKAQLTWAEKNRGQQKALLEKSFISQSAFDNIQSNYDVAAARQRAAEAELVVARKSLGDAVLVAPFSGIVSLRHAQPGERVSLDAKVVSIVDLSRLQLEASVPPAAIGQVKVGQELNFRVEGFGEREFAGRIERINPSATAGSRSISVYAAIDNRDGLLRGGMFAQGALTLSHVDGALAVPGSAVREEIGQNFVYTIEDGVVKKRGVKVGSPDATGQVQVLEGLVAGERIVRVNLGTLREGVSARLSGPQPSEAAKK
ncbi:MAG: efflux RND transporter periplasmic adaptor subunit [Candidatus Parcubacteria bacterium]|nr:efflux RND transporter periplasmic adaptor subunit [Burkholderiales bacterium]